MASFQLAAMTDSVVQRLAIQDAVLRYARAVDRSDWDSVRAAYHPDAIDDHGEFKGSIDELIEWLKARFAGAETGMHFIGNCLVELLDDRRALAETYFVSHRIRPPADEAEKLQCGPDGAFCRQGWGRYVDVFERREDGVWRVARRTVVMDSVIQMPVSGTTRSGETVWGRRDQLDWLYQCRAELFGQDQP